MKRNTANKMKVKVLIPESDNGYRRVTVYSVDGKIIEYQYNYGKSYGFINIILYDSIGHWENRLTQSGSKQIYSSGDTRNNTNYGRDVEFAIFEFNRMNKK